ncbi:MAG: cation transport protein ChaC [Paracoccaceae bacterium]|jgi:cation transport protein ChaC
MTDEPLWVFGYGSLIWNPGFAVAEQKIARLEGWHRSFCMSSIHHRGTVEEPGLVLALDKQDGAHCDGVAFRVPDHEADATMVYLRERELISSAYLERQVEISFRDGTRIPSVTYVIDAEHVQYVGDMTLEDQAQIIATAVGGRGPNDEYLTNTAAHLAKLKLSDPDLDWLVARVRRLKQRI